MSDGVDHARVAAPGEAAAVVLICDPNYLVPTLATALSADHHVAAPQVRIAIFVVGVTAGWCERLSVALAGTKIVFRPATVPALAEYAKFHRDRYLPPITLARFWLDELLDPIVDRFLYLDGDTMVDGELDSLLAAPPPDGTLMAASDVLRLFASEVSRSKRADADYLGRLACDVENYFNAGVIYTARSTWREIVPEAMAFFVGHPELCRSSDQSALNRAARGRVRLLPLRYNYQSEHMMAFDPRGRGLRPKVWHFTGGPKPWDAAGWPWDASFNRYYTEAEARLAGTGVGKPIAPEAQTIAGVAHRRRARNRLRWFFPWRVVTRRRRILQVF